jgi:uncharacterized Zn finger protein
MRYPQQPKVVCPYCGELTISRVVKSDEDRRLRLCAECGGTFPTVEIVDFRRLAPRHRPRLRVPLLPLGE